MPTFAELSAQRPQCHPVAEATAASVGPLATPAILVQDTDGTALSIDLHPVELSEEEENTTDPAALRFNQVLAWLRDAATPAERRQLAAELALPGSARDIPATRSRSAQADLRPFVRDQETQATTATQLTLQPAGGLSIVGVDFEFHCAGPATGSSLQ